MPFGASSFLIKSTNSPTLSEAGAEIQKPLILKGSCAVMSKPVKRKKMTRNMRFIRFGICTKIT